MSRGNKRTAIDLFAGAGGATQGLRNAGFEVLAAVENDRHAASTYSSNHSDIYVERQDIRAVRPTVVRDTLHLKPTDLMLLKACPPCQGYSSLGSQSPDDPRNRLVDIVWDWARIFVPKAVLLENVPGLLQDDRFTMLVRRLRGRGYRVHSSIMDARQFGVPQRRRRLIMLAVYRDYMRRTIDDLIALLPKRFVSRPILLEEIFSYTQQLTDQCDPLHRFPEVSAIVEQRIEAIPIGGNRFDLPAALQLRCHKGAGRVATASYGRIRLPGDAPTMTTRCTSPASGTFVHPVENRPITMREAALIQTFPPKYHFVGGRSAVERQIGNAVPVRMAEGLGLIVRAALE